MKVVIIGGGSAGINVATRFRRLDENSEIVILEKSNEFAVHSCALLDYLSGMIKSSEDLILTSVEDLKQRYNIDLKLNHEVDSINKEDKTLKIINRDDEYYDKLVITTGAYQLRPDIDGVLSENVFTIKNINSIDKIKDYIKGVEVKNALIVGGGYISIELIEALSKLKVKSTIIEASSHLIPSIDYDIAVQLHNHLRSKGVKLYLNNKVVAFEANKATLEDGNIIPYDMAIIATGVKPDLKLPIMADLKVGDLGGIIVNEYLQTSDKDIYAAGDDIEIIHAITKKPTRIAMASLALKEAHIIANNLAGHKSEFAPVLGAGITKAFDLTVASVGCNEKMLKENNIRFHKVHLYDYSNATYYPNSSLVLLKLLFDNDGYILGSQGIGQNGVDKRIDIIASYMSKKGKIEELMNAELCYAPPYSSARDPINNLGSSANNVLMKTEKFVFYEDIDWNNLTNETMLIDIRPHPMFLAEHIPNAINIPLEAIRNNLDSIPHNKQVIVYCNRGRAAYTASCILTNRGFNNIYVLSGGMDLYNQINEDKAHSNKSYEEMSK